MATWSVGRAAPRHLAWVGVLSLIWNSIGAMDYTLSELGNAAWFEMMGLGEAEIAYIASFPAWAVAVWAIGVWGSVAGSILLLLRSKLAVPAFALSLAGALVSFAYQFTGERPESMQGAGAMMIPAVITVLIVAQLLYARRMAAAGALT